MPKKPIKKSQDSHFSTRDFDSYVQKEAERTGKSKEVIIEETFHDGFLVVSETDGTFKVENSQLFKGDPATDPLAECRRLRKDFGPISDCVDYIKDMILGGGIDVFIDEPTNEHKKNLKKELLEWMRKVYQDEYTKKFEEIASILIDEALTIGFAAAEIVYEKKPKKNSLFDDYTEPVTQQIISNQGEKLLAQDILTYKIIEPDWKELDGISRLKIIRDANSRLKLYRTPAWEANYWALDEPAANPQSSISEQEIIAKSMRQSLKLVKKQPAALFLPWQIFSLALNRSGWEEKGTSIILPALSTAKLLEKILKAVGEGIHRAGNKKYFIICGTEKRPWSAVHIRNLLSQLKEGSEKSWSTIPVPSGFDLKEAGGEVFEAQNAVDYFLRIIAGTMHVPPSVLGIDFREEIKGEVPHYSYRRLQNTFKTAIETQLFRLHIWSTHGAKKGKQGGHEDPQYIPEVRIKSEALLNEQARLELNVRILNTANPVRPEMKLEAEREIAKLMGWDVLLPTQEEYKEELKKRDEEMKKELAKKDITPEKNLDEEKFQGEKKPPTEEQLQNRQEGGVNVRKVGSKKGQSREMGSTRIEETLQEPQKVEITVKSEPVRTEVTIKSPLDEKMKELTELETQNQTKQKELAEKEAKFAEEENTRKQIKLKADIEQIQISIKETNTRIEKLKIETEETKKTHAKKREVMDNIQKEGEW
jgi:hypothetical protein